MKNSAKRRSTASDAGTGSTASSEETLRWFELDHLEGEIKAKLGAILRRWFQEGRLKGDYWFVASPKQSDVQLSINLVDGRWREFPRGRNGPDLVSLITHLTGLQQPVVHSKLKGMLGK